MTFFFAGPDGKGSQRIGSINFCFAKKKGKPSKRWLKKFFFQYFFNCFCYMNKYSGEMNCFPSFSFFFSTIVFCFAAGGAHRGASSLFARNNLFLNDQRAVNEKNSGQD